MGYFDKYNRGSRFTADTSGYSGYVKPSELDMTDRAGNPRRYWISALYINTKSRYGDSPVAAVQEGPGAGCFVNLPAHELETVRDIIADDRSVDLVNRGKVYFTLEPYHSKTHDVECIGIRWGSVE